MKSVYFLLLALIMLSACLPKEEKNYSVPEDMWTAEIMYVEHGSSNPVFVVNISEEFDWPEPEGTEPVYYKLAITQPDQQEIIAGYIDQKERFAIHHLLDPRDFEFFTLDSTQQKQMISDREQKEDEMLEELSGLTLADSTRRDQLLLKLEELFVSPIDSLPDVTIDLIAYAGESQLLRQGQGKKPAKPTYDWSKRVNKPGDPCHGKTPAQCVNDKINDIINNRCRNPTAVMRPVCDELRRMRAQVPPMPVIVCNIPGKKGVTNILNGVVVLGGDPFISSTCGESTLLHETIHKKDVAGNEYNDLKEYARAVARREKAKKDMKEAQNEAQYTRAAADFARAVADIKRLRIKAGQQRMKLECKAYFFVIDNAAMFGYPPGNVQWMKDEAIGVVEEIVKTQSEFNLPHDDPEICKCAKRLHDWYVNQPQIQANLKKMKPNKNDEMTYDELIKIVKLASCGP